VIRKSQVARFHQGGAFQPWVGITQNPKTDTEESRGKLGQKSRWKGEHEWPRFVARWISQATCCLWKRQYSGVGISELRELRQLREENGRLKRLVALPASLRAVR
jgi:hypothetical protein